MSKELKSGVQNTPTNEQIVVTMSNVPKYEPATLEEVLAAEKGSIVNCTLTDLMNKLMGYKGKERCYMFSRTFPAMNKFSRASKDIACPYDNGRVVKLTKQFVFVNDPYEDSVHRRQITEAAMRGEDVNPDDLFQADKAAWGAKFGGKAPMLFEWWIPDGVEELRWYFVVKPIQHIDTWYEWTTPDRLGQRLTDGELKDLKDNYLGKKDREMDQIRQGVEKEVVWRKYMFQNVLMLTIDGVRHNVVDPTLPRLKPAAEAKLLKQIHDSKERAAMAKRMKALPANAQT